MQRTRYDGYKSTFSKPEPQGSGKWGFICLTIVCILIAAGCFGTVATSAVKANRAAAIAAAAQVRVAQAAAVQDLMTVFPKWERRAVKSNMENYLVSGAGGSGYNGTYTPNSTYEFVWQKDASHRLSADTNGNYALSPDIVPAAFGVVYQGSASPPAAPSTGTWSGGVTVTEVSSDSTAPTFASAAAPTDGNSVAVLLTEADSAPILPASGVTGFTILVNGVSRTISSATAATKTVTLNLATPVNAGDTVTVSYTLGNVTDSATNAMVAFGAQTVTNNSTVAKPRLKPVVMGSNGLFGNLQAGDDLAFTATTPLDWDTAAPTGISEAINRIAAELAVQKGSAIT